MVSVDIKLFQDGDEHAISEIHYLFRSEFEEDLLDPSFIRASALRDDFDFMIARLDGEVAGFCGMLYHPHVGRAEVGPIAVKPGFQNKGVGTLLLKDALGILSEVGVHRVIVRVKSENQRALSFFEKHGFQLEVILENYTRQGWRVSQLVRFL